MPDGLNRYMERWWWRKKSLYFDIFFHRLYRSDDDRAMHDHPRPNISIILSGEYVEHTIAAGGVHYRKRYRAGDVILRRATYAHRLEIVPGSMVQTMFIVGPEWRDWGFHFPTGWKNSKECTVIERGVGKRLDLDSMQGPPVSKV